MYKSPTFVVGYSDKQQLNPSGMHAVFSQYLNISNSIFSDLLGFSITLHEMCVFVPSNKLTL
jgi:hypothetical protein